MKVPSNVKAIIKSISLKYNREIIGDTTLVWRDELNQIQCLYIPTIEFKSFEAMSKVLSMFTLKELACICQGVDEEDESHNEVFPVGVMYTDHLFNMDKEMSKYLFRYNEMVMTAEMHIELTNGYVIKISVDTDEFAG